jgi:hypothetical protein
VKSVVEALVTVGHKELKKAGVLLVPGFAKFVVVKKPATKVRKGINPFTKNRPFSKRSLLGRSSGPGRSRPSRIR